MYLCGVVVFGVVESGCGVCAGRLGVDPGFVGRFGFLAGSLNLGVGRGVLGRVGGLGGGVVFGGRRFLEVRVRVGGGEWVDCWCCSVGGHLELFSVVFLRGVLGVVDGSVVEVCFG